ncbi:hypothetical protein DASC09_033880 [Saccharomycopsis crataegensis]|uniref:Uncharacterized protein n=1 Tax=Saccharomycopsis crataegensis TaxID=43959 RepID=A0AAV5QMG6_9ASCO|nr:hypothetical protein DASC09_033880 [Saccharomycopsis crataegensis]
MSSNTKKVVKFKSIEDFKLRKFKSRSASTSPTTKSFDTKIDNSIDGLLTANKNSNTSLDTSNDSFSLPRARSSGLGLNNINGVNSNSNTPSKILAEDAKNNTTSHNDSANGSTTVFFPKQRRSTSFNVYRQSIISTNSRHTAVSSMGRNSMIWPDQDHDDNDSRYDLHTEDEDINTMIKHQNSSGENINNKRFSLLNVVPSPRIGSVPGNKSEDGNVTSRSPSPQANLTFGSRRHSVISMASRSSNGGPPRSAGSNTTSGTKFSKGSLEKHQHLRKTSLGQPYKGIDADIEESSSTILPPAAEVQKGTISSITTTSTTPDISNNSKIQINGLTSRISRKSRTSQVKDYKKKEESAKYDRITKSLTNMFDNLQTSNQNKAALIARLQQLKHQNDNHRAKLDVLLAKIKEVETNFEAYDHKVDNDCTLIMICMCLIKNI